VVVVVVVVVVGVKEMKIIWHVAAWSAMMCAASQLNAYSLHYVSLQLLCSFWSCACAYLFYDSLVVAEKLKNAKIHVKTLDARLVAKDLSISLLAKKLDDNYQLSLENRTRLLHLQRNNNNHNNYNKSPPPVLDNTDRRSNSPKKPMSPPGSFAVTMTIIPPPKPTTDDNAKREKGGPVDKDKGFDKGGDDENNNREGVMSIKAKVWKSETDVGPAIAAMANDAPPKMMMIVRENSFSKSLDI